MRKDEEGLRGRIRRWKRIGGKKRKKGVKRYFRKGWDNKEYEGGKMGMIDLYWDRRGYSIIGDWGNVRRKRKYRKCRWR